jgi:cellulose synthase/poly-beta-1,6-N-acetylglucosamine synthase-like glycosyltransferase/peptidoglycan/xylan/chitin deacetylase (PgdA/CDA1 family)/spore germination protein YaaH
LRGEDAANTNGVKPNVNEPGQKPIFFDETNRRWGIVSYFFIAAGILGLLASLLFAAHIVLSPQLPSISLAASRLGLAPTMPVDARAKTFGLDKHALNPAARAKLHFVLNRNQPVLEAKRDLAETIRQESRLQAIPVAAIAPGHVSSPVRAAFFENDDKAAVDSLTQHVGQMTHLMPVWLRLTAGGKGIQNIAVFSDKSEASAATQADTNDDIALAQARSHGVAILPLIQNYDADTNTFRNDWLHSLVSSPEKRTAVVAQLKDYVFTNHYQGINIDFETDQGIDKAGLTQFMAQLAAAFHPLGLLVTQDVQTDSDAYDLPTLARVNDFVIPMLYDQHSDGTAAGSISGQAWYQSQLMVFLAQVPANKVVLGLGTYGYDWKDGTTHASDISFQQAAQVAQQNRFGDDGIIQIDPASLSPYFTYSDQDGGANSQEIAHTVWLQDATTNWNQMRAALPYHTLGAAIWELGKEDPSLWSFFGKADAETLAKFDPQSLSRLTYGKEFGTTFIGQGDVLDVVQSPTDGQRTIKTSPKTHLVTAEQFLKYPSQWVIRRTGLVNQNTGANNLANGLAKGAKGYIALTFDDGPDPRWTPQILDILHRYHVPATFFVVGQNVEAHPGLLSREWNEGMEIGNHSYTHPEMDNVSPLRTKVELDATQRLIEAITGHMTTLWRSPNRADSEPSTEEDFNPIYQGDQLGYLFIGEQIDPTDWKPGITSDQIVKNALGNAGNGNCILLHDAGGDTRAETIKALPQIIEGLKAKGYAFVPVSALVGKSKSVLFPEVKGRQLWGLMLDRAIFDMSYWVGTGFTLLFLLAIGLGISRMVFMGILASIQAKRESARVFDTSYTPSVSVIIAAYNEAKVINKTIATLLSSDYPDLDILVIDDGSKDNTAEVVTAAYGTNPRVTVIEKANGGKASALNLGIKQCRGEIIVALDADTVFDPDTVSKLVRHFADPAIGAVSGNVKVGNRNNPLTIWQAVEYITSQNFDRRAFDLLNCITVVPGAVGAWRKDAVILAGLYSSQTLAEDTDLTFKIRKLGYRISTDNTAMAYTEAPDTLRDLAKQRFRWAFGTLQCLWKHRSALMNPRYGAFGTIAMPSLWIYQIGFQAIAPVVDLTIVWSLFYGRFIASSADQKHGTILLWYWAVFSAIELLGAWLAFRLDKEDKKLLGWLLLQRFVYRQLMYYVIVKSLIFAVRGSLVGWGKFERKGTVQQPTGRIVLAEPSSERGDISAK